MKRRKAIARSNSSFFTSIGSLMGAIASPLTWFSGVDDDEVGSKRRTVDQSRDENPKKRQRIHSPEPYLDPPNAAFQSQMVVDGPSRDNSMGRDGSRDRLMSTSFSRDHSMNREYSLPTRDHSLPTRDHSMPAARPSFKMRTSLTPQPTREISEPPSLSSLIHKPMFIHAPQEQPRKLSVPATLGTLVESQRTVCLFHPHSLEFTRSQTRPRQHSLFGSSSSEKPSRSSLQDLDVYKTPLVPTRLRSMEHVATSDNITDMFRRRPSKLIPMFDDDGVEVKSKKKSKKKGKSEDELNDTKPYAGEGGMRRLLAKRREEEEEARRRDEKEAERLALPPARPSSHKDDWLSLANAGAKEKQRPTESSLRVGRTLTERKHIHRPGPLGPVRSKFSATYEEEEDMGDSDEKQMLEEAAKRIPIFDIPKDFTFDLVSFFFSVNYTHLLQPKNPPAEDPDAKEPPIVSLPFSFSVPITPPPTAKSPPPVDPTSAAPISSAPEPAQMPKFFANVKHTPPPVPASSSLFRSPALASAPPIPVKDDTNPFWDGEKKTATKPNGVFSSEKGKENLSITPAPESSASGPSATLTPAVAPNSGSLFGTPKKEGDKGLFSPFNPAQTAPPFSFTKSTEIGSIENKAESSSSLFGGLSSTTTATPALFSDVPKPTSAFADVSKTSVSLGDASKPLFSSSAPDKPPKSLSGIGTLIENSKPVLSAPGEAPLAAGPTEAPRPLFSAFASSDKPTIEEAKPAAAEVLKPAFTFGDSKTTKPTSLFGAPSAAKPAAAEVLKPAFTFGDTDFKTTKPTSLFGAPSAAETETPFSFTPPATSTATSSPFSFTSSSTDTSSKPFVFGAPTSTDSRPVTPPRNDSQDPGDRMDESPTRDLSAQPKPAEPRPTLGGSSFSFPSSTATNPFAFNAPASSVPFGSSKLEEPKPFGGFGQSSGTSTGSPFLFAPKPQPEEPPRPSTTGSFSFPTPTSSGSGPGFTFGGPSSTTLPTTPNPFAQPQGGSAPSSPSTFATQPSFTFGTSSSTQTNPFTFGSQPSSPAATPSGLPPPAISSGSFAFGSNSPQSSTPFGAPPASGGTLFNMGSVSTTQNSSIGGRQIKKLPTRRGGKR